MLFIGIKLKKSILLIPILCFTPLAFADIDKYIYSSIDEVKEIVTDMCDNPELDISCRPFPRYELISNKYVITNYDLSFGRDYAVDFIEGNFSGSNLKEGVLVAGNREADWYPRYTLVQKKAIGWYPIFPTNNKDNFLGAPYALVQGSEKDSVITLPGSLQGDEVFGGFRIYIASFKDGILETETLFQMPQTLPRWSYCNSFRDRIISKAISDGSPLATFNGFRQQDLNNNGFKDLILDVSIRYWKNKSIYLEPDLLDCEAIYFSLPVEHHEVIFTFDGYSFTPDKNVDWLHHIYESEK